MLEIQDDILMRETLKSLMVYEVDFKLGQKKNNKSK
jgi:hypothetical protein